MIFGAAVNIYSDRSRRIQELIRSLDYLMRNSVIKVYHFIILAQSSRNKTRKYCLHTVAVVVKNVFRVVALEFEP